MELKKIVNTESQKGESLNYIQKLRTCLNVSVASDFMTLRKS